MNDGAQLSLFDLGPATRSAADFEAMRVAGIREKVETEDFRGEDYEPDFGDE